MLHMCVCSIIIIGSKRGNKLITNKIIDKILRVQDTL